MSKTLIALAAATTIALGAVAVPRNAEARCMGCVVGAGVFAGVLLGSAIANAGPYGHSYYYSPDYVGPPCVWRKHKYWDGYGWTWRRERVCY